MLNTKLNSLEFQQHKFCVAVRRLGFVLLNQKLWTPQFKDNTTERKWKQSAEKCVELITMEELEKTINAIKPSKSPVSDGINNELYKTCTQKFFT
jgi:hypothetical protein